MKPRKQMGRIGPFRILDALGSGGGGVVYRASHAETGETVALKTVRVPHAGLLQGIRREIQVLARLRHPAVVRIVAEGVEQGVPWYAMELIEGSTLRSYCRAVREATQPAADETVTNLDLLSAPDDQPPRSSHRAAGEAPGADEAQGPEQIRAVLTVVRRLCTPLAYLHGEGIVHRDIKPANVLVRPDGHPVLVDFGLIALSGGEASREALDVLGGMSGTVAYMAPEQIQGEPVDARADLYALGCVLYELLTGRQPFRGEEPRSVLAQHLSSQATPPSELVPGLSREVDALAQALLAKRPRDRIGHADDVAAALERLGAEPSPPPSPAPRAYLYRPGLAGRERELASLDGALDRLDEGAGGLMLIGGESGVGKTRLVMELTRMATRMGVLVLTGGCSPAIPGARSSAVPLQALREPLQALADRCRERGLAETEALLGQRGRLLALYEPALYGLAGQERYPEPAELPAEAARLRLNAFLAETLLALTGRGRGRRVRVLLLLDDLQWADELSLGFLEFLLRGGQMAEAPLLVVGTYRSEESSSGLRGLVDKAAEDGEPTLQLDRLDEAAVTAMVGDMLALATPPAAFCRFLALQSEGNPFFVAEYLRAAVAESILHRSADGRWRVRLEQAENTHESRYEDLALPRSLQELVGRRLAGLGEAARGLTEGMAVLGREASYELSAAVSGIEAARVLEGIEELHLRQVLEEPRPGLLRFVHDKLREVSYSMLSEPRRRRLHGDAAAALEARLTKSGDRLAASIGDHWDKAGFPVQARLCYLEGARHSLGAFAHEEAERLYASYLSLARPPDLESIAVRIELAQKVLFLQARIEEALVQLRQALLEAQDLHDLRLEATASRGLGMAYRALGLTEPSLQALSRALELFVRLGDGEGETLLEIGQTRMREGRLDEAQKNFDQAQPLHRNAGDKLLEAKGLAHSATLHGLRGELTEAGRLLFEALDLLQSAGDQHGEALCLANLGTLHAQLGDWAACTRYTEEALRLNRQIGNRWFEAIGLGNLGACYRLTGQDEKAQVLYEQALALNRSIGNHRSEALILSNLAGLVFAQGRPDQARKLYEQALSIQRRLEDHFHESTTLAFLAIFERRSSGDLGRAARLLDQAEAIGVELRAAMTLLWCLCERGHLALAAGLPADEILQQAHVLALAHRSGPESDVGRAIGRLERAVEARERGEAMFRGERLEDLPEGLRRWLRETGLLGEPEAKPRRRSRGKRGDGRERPRAT